jgi:outer membrane protein TolC
MRKRRVFLPALVMVSNLVAAADLPARGAAANNRADLGPLLDEAEASHPAIRAAAARLDAARRRPSQAGTRPDPEVSLTYVNDGVSHFTLGESEFAYLGLNWTQEMPYPGKPDRAREVALAEVEIADRDLARTRFEVRSRVKVDYADLYRLDRTRDTLQETRATLDSLAQAALRRYEVGEATQESVLKAQTQILRLEAEIARVEQDRNAAEVRLFADVGRSDGGSFPEVSVLPSGSLPPDPAALASDAAATSPEVAGLEASVRRVGAETERARLDLKPDFSWSASYQYRGGLDPMVAGMFGVRLPVHRGGRQAEALAQAESESTAAGHELAGARLRTEATVRTLYSQAERAARLIVLFEQGIVPQAQAALDSAQASYSVGRVGFLDLLNDLTVLLNARIDLATQEAERMQALAALEPLLGRDLVGGGDTAAADDSRADPVRTEASR